MKRRSFERKMPAQDYLSGSIPRQMILFALPHMLSSTLQIMYSAVDLSIVGHAVSGAAISAVSTSSHVLNLLTMLGLGFATGGQVYMAQLLGMKKGQSAKNVVATLFIAMLGLSLMLAFPLQLMSRPILRLLKTPPDAFAMANSYLRIGCLGIVFTYAYNCFAGILRAFGNSKLPMYAVLCGAVVNLVLDVLFVIVRGGGVVGAAWATVIGQAVSALIELEAICRHRNLFCFALSRECFRVDRKTLKSITLLAIPYALENAVFHVSMLFVNAMVNAVGLYASEAFGIGLKVEEIGNKLCTGITCAVSVMVGQNMAAGQVQRTKKIVHCAWGFGVLVYGVFAVVCSLWSKQLFLLFVKDEAVISMAPMFISALRWGFPAMASMRGTNGLLQGVSNARLSFVIGMIDGLLVRIPLCYILGVKTSLGLYGFYLAYALAAYANAGLGLLYYLSGKWKTRRLAAQQ